METSDGLIPHMESYLGTIEAGWGRDVFGGECAIQVALYEQAEGGDVAFTTLGMNRYPVQGPTGKTFRQELLMLASGNYKKGPIPGILHQVAVEAVGSGRAIVRGQVIGPRDALFSGTHMEALYVAFPVYMPKEFATARVRGEDVIIPWLVPITRNEAAYIEGQGWRAFEDLLVDRDPALLDFSRTSVV